MWKARVEYADGTSRAQMFPYNANGSCRKEAQEQYDIECFILLVWGQDKEIVWYSVDYVEV